MADKRSHRTGNASAVHVTETRKISRVTSQGPVIVLTFAHAGADLLAEALSASPSLACTVGAGLVPLCDSAATTWQLVDGREPAPSRLAATSIRSLVTTMAVTLQARMGASRWCEVAFAAPAMAETFLEIFPETAFLCLYRSLRGVLAEATAAYPWGLGGSPFWPYPGGHPGNSVTTITAYWMACTESLLDFEAKHGRSCLRIRYEDLCARQDQEIGEILAHLEIDSHESVAFVRRRGFTEGGARQDVISEMTSAIDHIPQPARARVNELHERLNYAAYGSVLG